MEVENAGRGKKGKDCDDCLPALRGKKTMVANPYYRECLWYSYWREVDVTTVVKWIVIE